MNARRQEIDLKLSYQIANQKKNKIVSDFATPNLLMPIKEDEDEIYSALYSNKVSQSRVEQIEDASDSNLLSYESNTKLL